MKSSLDLTTSYLNYGYQKVVITGVEFDWIVVGRSVPQGTILGPLLFNLYVSDKKNTSNCQLIKYADDTLFLESEKT